MVTSIRTLVISPMNYSYYSKGEPPGIYACTFLNIHMHIHIQIHVRIHRIGVSGCHTVPTKPTFGRGLGCTAWLFRCFRDSASAIGFEGTVQQEAGVPYTYIYISLLLVGSMKCGLNLLRA